MNTAEQSTFSSEVGGSTYGDRLVIKDRYHILVEKRLPHLDNPGGAEAYAVGRITGEGPALFALVCKEHHFLRTEALQNFSRLQNAKCLVPIESAVCPWPLDGLRHPIMIFEQPRGPKLGDTAGGPFQPWREDQVRDILLSSVIPLLGEMEDRYLTHRGIRLENVFFGDLTQSDVVLGEALSGPPAYWQPAVYETIESAMANPGGRGEGSPADDIYALGVLILMLLNGGNPLAHLSDDEIIESKIERGSYATLVAQIRLSLHMVELLRGLICDNPDERWTADDVRLWLNGRHLSPKQPILPRKAQRGFTFLDSVYYSAEGLAFALARNWSLAREVVLRGQVEVWVRRSLADDEKADMILRATQSVGAGADGEANGDRALAQVLIALHPRAPIRLRHFSARIDGVFRALAVTYDDLASQAHFLEVIKGKLWQSWIEFQKVSRPEHNSYKRDFGTAVRRLTQNRPGYGLERVLYEFNSGLPCLSPMIGGNFVGDVKSLMVTLDRMAPSDPDDKMPIDTHIVAMLAAHHTGMPEAILRGLGERHDEATYRLDMLRLLCEGQRAFGPAHLPALTRWFSDLCTPVLESYRSRETRERLAREMQAEIETGSLNGLFYLIDDYNTRLRDNTGFDQAQALFLRCAREAAWIRAGGLTEPAYVKKLARPIAATVSAVGASLSLLVMTLLYVT